VTLRRRSVGSRLVQSQERCHALHFVIRQQWVSIRKETKREIEHGFLGSLYAIPTLSGALGLTRTAEHLLRKFQPASTCSCYGCVQVFDRKAVAGIAGKAGVVILFGYVPRSTPAGRQSEGRQYPSRAWVRSSGRSASDAASASETSTYPMSEAAVFHGPAPSLEQCSGRLFPDLWEPAGGLSDWQPVPLPDYVAQHPA
jgi:hypothetical protein